jgi:hypothetical protein
LLQSLVTSECADVQCSLIAAVERLSITEVTSLSLVEVTRLCA